MRSETFFIPVMPRSTNAIYAGHNFKIVIVSRAKAKSLGCKFYFTGKACPKGHISTRYVNGTACTTCSAEYRNKNRKKAAETTKRWRDSNPERAKESTKKWHNNNREEANARRHKRCLENLEQESEARRIWRKNNPEKIRENNKRYVKENMERNRSYWRNSRAKRFERMKSGVSSKELFEWEMEQEKVCFWCGTDVSGGYHVDHYIPLSKGGEHKLHNLRISCPTCNIRKHAKMPEEFMAIISETKS